MEKIQKLVEKSRKLRPWIFLSIILFVLGIICMFTLAIFTSYFIFAYIIAIPTILILMPAYIDERIYNNNIPNEIKNIFCDKLKVAIDDEKALENIQVEIDSNFDKMVGSIYTITVSSDCLTVDKLSATFKEIVDNMTCELNHIFKVSIKVSILKSL